MAGKGERAKASEQKQEKGSKKREARKQEKGKQQKEQEGERKKKKGRRKREKNSMVGVYPLLGVCSIITGLGPINQNSFRARGRKIHGN